VFYIHARITDRKNVKILAVEALRQHLPSDIYAEYEISEIVVREGAWSVRFLNKKHQGVLGNDITVIVENNQARILYSE
jgi:hypothetical protein